MKVEEWQNAITIAGTTVAAAIDRSGRAQIALAVRSHDGQAALLSFDREQARRLVAALQAAIADSELVVPQAGATAPPKRKLSS